MNGMILFRFGNSIGSWLVSREVEDDHGSISGNYDFRSVISGSFLINIRVKVNVCREHKKEKKKEFGRKKDKGEGRNH